MPVTPRALRYRLILLPVSSAKESRHAAMHTAALASALGATIAILGMMDTGGELAFTPVAAVNYMRLRAEAQEAIEATSAIIREANAREANIPLVEHLIMDGVPATMIVETAAELGADLIVLGIERSTEDGIVSPIVAAIEAVLRNASCPVLIVPPPVNERTERR